MSGSVLYIRKLDIQSYSFFIKQLVFSIISNISFFSCNTLNSYSLLRNKGDLLPVLLVIRLAILDLYYSILEKLFNIL